MKQIRPFIGFVVCSLVLAMAVNLHAQGQEGFAKVVNIKGDARYMTTQGGTWQPLKNGTVLKAGAIIQTAARSYVDLIFNNQDAKALPTPAMANVGFSAPLATQDAVRLFENTVLGVDQLTVAQTGADKVTETQLDLKAGRILGTVKKLSGASKYEVKIPNGVAGIRGTIYTLSADGVLSVLSGSVVFAYIAPDGTVLTQVVTAGQQFDSRSGQLSSIPNMDELRSAAQTFTATKETVTFISDPQIYYVSPTQGN
jgi:hypothetical protein